MTTTAPESPLAARHRAAGAATGVYFGVALPASFDALDAEHQRARQSAAIVDTNFRAVFSLTGPDRVRYLNAVLSSNVRDLTPGAGALGLLLNSQGHILAELTTLAVPEKLIVLGHQMVGQKTAETLEKFIIMDDAASSDETAQWGTLAVEGPAAPEIVKELTGLDLPSLAPLGHATAAVQTAAGAIPCRAMRHSLYGFPGAEFLVAREALPSLWDALLSAARARGGGPIGYRALDALRLEAGMPWFGVDFDERHIPHEAALEISQIDYTKGCYTGQEIVERVRSRGQVNRRRSGLQFAGPDAPPPGALLLVPGAKDAVEAGSVTSAAFSPLLGRAIGMGYVRREHNQRGTALTCAGAAVEVIELPLRSAVYAAG